MQLLEVNQLSKTYGSGDTAVHALKSASFTLQKGEFAAIVGESGSGKSTLLNLIGGLDTPTSGIFTERQRTDGFPSPQYRFYIPVVPSDPGAERRTEYHVPGASGFPQTR